MWVLYYKDTGEEFDTLEDLSNAEAIMIDAWNNDGRVLNVRWED